MKFALALAIGVIGVATLSLAANPAKSANTCAATCAMPGHMAVGAKPMKHMLADDTSMGSPTPSPGGSVMPKGEPRGEAAAEAMQSMNDAHILAGHMTMTKTRPVTAADKARADAILAALRKAIEPYKDYRVAEQAGYRQFLPNIKQPMYHFTNWANAYQNVSGFDPTRPTSLMYAKTADGFKLVGAMYTADVRASDAQLDARVPLSIAAWHLHTNYCVPPPGRQAELMQMHTQFGLQGTITTADACQKAGGSFKPVIYNWMVHVWPYETDPTKVWATQENPGMSGHMGDM